MDLHESVKLVKTRLWNQKKMVNVKKKKYSSCTSREQFKTKNKLERDTNGGRKSRMAAVTGVLD